MVSSDLQGPTPGGVDIDIELTTKMTGKESHERWGSRVAAHLGLSWDVFLSAPASFLARSILIQGLGAFSYAFN